VEAVGKTGEGETGHDEGAQETERGEMYDKPETTKNSQTQSLHRTAWTSHEGEHRSEDGEREGKGYAKWVREG
jgi:hypothetical protein